MSRFAYLAGNTMNWGDESMPFRSKSQQRYLFANDPEVAKEFAKETKNFKTLPEKVSNKSLKKKKAKRHA